MIKKGDKVICIKDYSESYKVNKQYEILEIAENRYYISSDIEEYYYIGTWFYKIAFVEYFMPLAEWREKQINSILDEK